MKETGYSIQVITGGQTLTPLPLIDGLRLLKTQKRLQLPDTDTALLPQFLDPPAGGFQINPLKISLHNCLLSP